MKSPFWHRLIPCGCALLVFVAFAGLYLAGATGAYQRGLDFWGFHPTPEPFFDLAGELSWGACARLGYDVMASNPCDPSGRLFIYGPLYLPLLRLPLQISWAPLLGIVRAGGFLLCLPFLPPGRRWRDVAVISLANVSSVVVFAVERGQVDLVIFIAACLVGWLSQRRDNARFLAYPIVLGASLLKFYPIALLVVAGREKFRIALAAGVPVVVAFAVVLLDHSDTVGRALAMIPTPTDIEKLDMIGAPLLPMAISRELAGTDALVRPVMAALTLLAASLGWAVLRLTGLNQTLRRLSQAEGVFLLIGATLILFCFFAGQNVAYRGIFLLLALPGLTFLWGEGGSRRGRTTFAAVTLSALALMWSQAYFPLHPDYIQDAPRWRSIAWEIRHVLWLIREATWWGIVGVLGAILFCQLTASEAWCSLWRGRAGTNGEA